MRLGRRTFLTASALLIPINRSIPLTQNAGVEHSIFGPHSIAWLRDQLLTLVNIERQLAHAGTLQMDELASTVAMAHATDMADGDFLSHWGRDGRKPYQRYTFAGGSDAVQENVSAADNIQSSVTQSIGADLTHMHVRMHDETPPDDGHRRAMLSRQNTHVGFGIALKDRRLRLTELYVARYLTVDSFQREARRKSTMVLTGTLLNKKHSLYQVDVCFEALPAAAQIDWLRIPRPYSYPATSVGLRPRAPYGTTYSDGSTGDFTIERSGRFRVPVYLFKDSPGMYTILFWITKSEKDRPFTAAQVCIACQ